MFSGTSFLSQFSRRQASSYVYSDTIPDSYPDNGNCNWPYISRFRNPPVPPESHRITDSVTFSHKNRKCHNHSVPSSEIHTVRKSSLLRSSEIHWSSYWSHFPCNARPSHNDTSRINASADAQWFHVDTATYVSTIPAHESACHSPAFWKWIRLLFSSSSDNRMVYSFSYFTRNL